jgi:hypothetical protein
MNTVCYAGNRASGTATVWIEDKDGARRPLPLRHDLRNHSPTGAEWGYDGSGPAQLALSILCDALGDRAALIHYQDFKFQVVAGFQQDRWELSRSDVEAWYAKHRVDDGDRNDG